MKLRFWLLDINAERIGNRPEIRLWGLDDRTRRVLVIDRSTEPSFYLLPKADADVEALCEAIQQRRMRLKDLAQAKVVDRRYLGKPLKSIQVTVHAIDPAAVSRLAKQLTKLKGIEAVLEDDLRYSMQYLLDKTVLPCGWHIVEATSIPIPSGTRVDAVFLADTPPRALEQHAPPSLRAMAFTFAAYNPLGTPKAERDPIVILAAITSDGQRKVWAAEEDDGGVIAGFTEFVQQYDPDILFGYGSNARQWPYLLARARVHSRTLAVDRAGMEPHPSLHGHFSITGRAQVDLFDFAEELSEVKHKTLENVGRFLGFHVTTERIDGMDIPLYWADRTKRPLLTKQITRDAALILDIGRSSLDHATQLSQLVGIPLDHVLRAATGFRVENLLLKTARQTGELAPKRIERPYIPYVGGLVMAPRPGLHKQVAVLDFRSMYPNLMIRYNISPDTYVEPEQKLPEDRVFIAPEVGHRFLKEPPGLYKKVLTGLMSARDTILERMRRLDPGSVEYRLLDARQKVVKIITNATYGYAGWLGARWYLRPVAEAATAWGRATITRSHRIAQEVGLEILYSDTDSLFTRYDAQGVERFARRIEQELGLEIRPEKIYDRLLFTEAKKRYAGLLPDGTVEIVGLEVVRGDWANVAKVVQEEVLGLILRERPLEEARNYVRRLINSLRARKIPFRDLIIWKTLTKPIEEYATHTPHVSAARRLAEAGYPPHIGDHIGYVITKGTGRLFERAIPYQLAKYEDVDAEYYVTNQIVPAALRVLEGSGLSEADLLT